MPFGDGTGPLGLGPGVGRRPFGRGPMMCPVRRALLEQESGQDDNILKGEQVAGGHAGYGQSSGQTTGGSTEPTTQEPPNMGPVNVPAGEFRGSEFASKRMGVHRISE